MNIIDIVEMLKKENSETNIPHNEWLNSNPELKAKFIRAVNLGLVSKIKTDLSEINFEKHIDHVISAREDPFYFLAEITNGHVLRKEKWFIENNVLQEKLREVVSMGLECEVYVEAPEFEKHLDEIISFGIV